MTTLVPRDTAPVRRRGGMRPGGDRGSITAELTLILPSVVVLLAVIVQIAVLGAARTQLQDAAALAARLQARGEPAQPALAAGPAAGSTRMYTERHDGLLCVHLRQDRRILGLVPIRLEARGCALTGGL